MIGWTLDRTLEDELTLTALRMALARRAVQPGLVHHSDRASNDYTDLLHQPVPNMRYSHLGSRGDFSERRTMA
jgi:transposase InsO family protein